MNVPFDIAADRKELAEAFAFFDRDEAGLVEYTRHRLGTLGLKSIPEVWSTDRKSRIDIVVWTPDRTFIGGVEVKVAGRKQGKSIGAWLAQAQRYRYSRFVIPFTKEPQGLDIFVFPQISGLYLDEGILMHQHPLLEATTLGPQHNVSTLLGALGLGEVQLYRHRRDTSKKYGWRFVKKGRTLWQSPDHRNPHPAASNGLPLASDHRDPVRHRT